MRQGSRSKLDHLINTHGGFGRVGQGAAVEHPRTADFPLIRGLDALAAAVPTVPRRRRRWRLPRLRQIDQGNTPWCCPTTGKHWERSAPVTEESGETNGELYAECKTRDGYPTEEGTDGHALLEVYRAKGMAGSFYWAPPEDTPESRAQVHHWLAEVGPMWWGAYWSYAMCTPDAQYVMDCSGVLELGHETLIIGTDLDMFGPGEPGKEVCNSWGLTNFGDRGRAFVTDDNFYRVLRSQGDLAGVLQTVRA